MRWNVPWGQRAAPWVMVLPCLALLATFTYRPVARSVDLSLYSSDLLGLPRDFVGLHNYALLLATPEFWRAVAVTATIALASTALATGGALATALALRGAGRRPRGILSILLSLPFAYSAASASAVFAGLFAPSVGTVNVLLGAVGLPGPGWLTSPSWAVVSIVIATAWYEFGFAVLVLLAALTTIDPAMLEAAALDGAGEWRTAVSIVVPALRPSLIFLVVTQTTGGLQAFTQVQILTRGGPGNASSTVVYQLYQRAFGDGLPNYGAASAYALTLLVLVVGVAAFQLRLTRDAR